MRHWGVRGIVGAACRRPRAVVVLGLVLGVVALVYLATHFAISTDTEALISQKVAWRRDATIFDRTFPGKSDEIVVVVDGATAELAEKGAAALAAKLDDRRDLFRAVIRPAGGSFFDQEGLLFLPRKDVKASLDALLAAQPLLGPLSADPSLRGVMTSLTSALGPVKSGSVSLSTLATPMRALADQFAASLQGRQAWFAWSDLLSAQPDPAARRQLVLLEPRLDYAQLEPGAQASAATRAAARQLGLTPQNGFRVRLTGSVVLDDEQLGSLADGVLPVSTAMLAAVVALLWLAVGSPKIILAILATVFVGLFATTAMGLLLFGTFNLISVAFVALFVGLGVDFAIQFGVRQRAVRARGVSPASAPEIAGVEVGGALAIAAAATSIGFFAFTPTNYVGFSQLGVIAGIGMILAFLLSLTLLPALLTLLRPGGAAEDAEFAALAPVGRWLGLRRGKVLWSFAATALVCALLLPLLRFDFDPVSLDSPRTESVSTLRDLAKRPETTLNTLDVLAPSTAAAQALAQRLAASPRVARAVTLTTFVPDDQPAKLALIADAANLLAPSLDPFDVAAPPSDGELVQSLGAASTALLDAAGRDATPAGVQARRLAGLLARLAGASPQTRVRAQDGLTAGLPTLLNQLKAALTARPVTLDTLPDAIVQNWRAADGRVRIQVFPSGDTNNPTVIDRFVAAVQAVAPQAVGAPIAVRGSRTTILAAFAAAMALSSAAMILLLAFVLRNVRQVGLTLAPVALAALLTFATCAVSGMAINVENIIAVPLIVSVGTAFTIYLTLAWRGGAANLLDTSVARAVLFSALTTALAFGSLWLSPHPGTSSLGALLMISLGWTLLCALALQPALLGPPAKPYVPPSPQTLDVL